MGSGLHLLAGVWQPRGVCLPGVEGVALLDRSVVVWPAPFSWSFLWRLGQEAQDCLFGRGRQARTHSVSSFFGLSQQAPPVMFDPSRQGWD